MRKPYVAILMAFLAGCGTQRTTDDAPEQQVAKSVDYSAVAIGAPTPLVERSSTEPDALRPASFAPTTIKDIQSANPGDGINLIEPPEPHSSGDARLSYPIQVPPGRHGMQPDIAIRYDSSKGNGFCLPSSIIRLGML